MQQQIMADAVVRRLQMAGTTGAPLPCRWQELGPASGLANSCPATAPSMPLLEATLCAADTCSNMSPKVQGCLTPPVSAGAAPVQRAGQIPAHAGQAAAARPEQRPSCPPRQCRSAWRHPAMGCAGELP